MALSTYIREFFAKYQLILADSNDVQVNALAEADGSTVISNYGKASGTLTAFKVETTGELDIVGHGKDSSGNIDPVRTNDNQQLMVETYEDWQIVDPYLLTTSDAIAYNPGSTATDKYLVEMVLKNFSNGARDITIYVDVAAGGTAGNAEYILNAENIPAYGTDSFTVLIGGDDDIRAFVDGSGANACNLRFRVRRVGRS